MKKISEVYHNSLLSYYESCAQKAKLMKFKAKWPEQYRDSVVLSAFDKKLTRYEKKNKLSERQLKQVYQIYAVAQSLAETKDTSAYSVNTNAHALSERAKKLLPEVEMISGLQNIVDTFLKEAESNPDFAKQMFSALKGETC